eukprot:5559866-Pyramimonas_sp.AAC.1
MSLRRRRDGRGAAGAMTWRIATTRFAEINALRRPNRTAWLQDMAYAQWQRAELPAGIAVMLQVGPLGLRLTVKTLLSRLVTRKCNSPVNSLRTPLGLDTGT